MFPQVFLYIFKNFESEKNKRYSLAVLCRECLSLLKEKKNEIVVCESCVLFKTIQLSNCTDES